MTRVPYFVAHRGVSAAYPENTLVAFQAAVALEVDWIELDVVTTSDGVVIVSHDRTADRCTDGTGLFKTKSLDEVKRLDAGIRFDEQFAGEKIPTLDEVISLVEPSSVRLCIEIKGDTPEDTLANARATVTLVQQRNFVQKTSIASFEPRCLQAIREWEPLLAINFDPMPQDGTLTPWELCQQALRVGASQSGEQIITPAVDPVHDESLVVCHDIS